MRNLIDQFKNVRDNLNNKLGEVEERTSEIEGKYLGISQTKKLFRKNFNLNSAQDLWDVIKTANICVLGIHKHAVRGNGLEGIFSEIAENFHNFEKDRDTQI